MSALNQIQKLFPQVKRVVDARESIRVTVKAIDGKSARKKDPGDCALAKACRREHLADATMIGLVTSYLIKGDIATRYRNAPTVSREITSFDRHHDFAVGRDYCLMRVSKSQRLDRIRGGHVRTITGKKAKPRIIHRTVNVRKLGL